MARRAGHLLTRLTLEADLFLRSRITPRRQHDLALFDDVKGQRSALVAHFNATTDSLRQVLLKTSPLRDSVTRVIYVTDTPDFEPLRENACIFEYLPPPPVLTRFSSGPAAADFLEVKWAQIQAKWSPDVVLHFGTTIDETVKTLRTLKST